ncbi:hypothetical protein [Faecalitalea cylindroides]|uniref:hypothetical protein n=1 Tax=Faecalitalea cylindroides TaxID=39483 RepID=UPI00195D49FC|nr:hypothetical protein [Faecalitalea cylindroides]MBM6652917.1 hypothetical protein [Faecalitalea cylindroides]
MKKILALCLCLGLITGLNYYSFTIEAKEEHGLVVLTEKEKDELKKQQNFVIPQEQLIGTEFEGKYAEVIEGELYIDGTRSLSLSMWVLVNANWILVAYMTTFGGPPIYTGNYPPGLTNEVISAVRNAWSKYQNMTDAYCRTRSTFSSFRLANGNECVVNSNGTSYTCKFSYDL